MTTLNHTFLRFGKTIETSIIVEELPPTALAYLLDYGAKQSLADSFASAKNEAEFEAQLAKRLDAIKAGTVGTRTRIADPTERVIREVALEEVERALRKAGHVVSKVEPAEIKRLVGLHVGKNRDRLAEEAKRRIEAIVDIEVDLSPAPKAEPEAQPEAQPEPSPEPEPQPEPEPKRRRAA